MDHIDRLLNLVPPHGGSVHTPEEWRELESHMGISFPEDYVQFVNAYGGGIFCSLVAIPDPFRAPPEYGKTTKEWWTSWSGIFTCWGEEPDSILPYPLFPAVPGLLTWGTYSDENVLGWVTSTRQKEWHVIYKDMRGGFFELQEWGFAQFLVACVEGTLPRPLGSMFERMTKEELAYEEYRLDRPK